MKAQTLHVEKVAPIGRGSMGALTTVFVIALVFRIAVALWLPQEVIWPDGSRYEQVALNVLQHGGFGSLGDNRHSVPTQPLLIAAVYEVFGQDYRALRICFAVLGSLSCLLGAILAQRHFGRLAGVFAGLMLAGYPYLVYLSALFEYPQTFFILAMAAFFLCYYRFVESSSRGMLFLAAICLGLSILSVPGTLIYAGVFGLLLLTKDPREVLLRWTIVGLALGLTVGAWTLRNYVAYDKLIVVNTAGGGSFWAGNNETYWKYGKGSVVPACAPGYEETVYCKQFQALQSSLDERSLTDVERSIEEDRVSWEHGREFVKEDPSRFALLTLKKFVNFWSPAPDAVHNDEAHGGKWRDLIATLSYTPIVLLALYGLISTFSRWRLLLPIYAYVVAFVVPYAFFLPATRYRLPIDFILIIFAAPAVARVWAFFRPSADGNVTPLER